MTTRATFLGIEIGGTKLQLGLGDGQTPELLDLLRADVEVELGAQGIVKAIQRLGSKICAQHPIQTIGVGFGGPVDIAKGVVTKSHQIAGWDDYPLSQQLSDTFGLRVAVDNDCNVAALGEAKLGAGKGRSRVAYVTVGTGIGGGFVVDGKLDGNHRPAICEIGHLRPGVHCNASSQTVESISSGWGISNWVREQLRKQSIGDSSDDAVRSLIDACDGHIDALSTKQIGLAAVHGNELAAAAIDRSAKTLGWAIAQFITLAAPEVVVVGGGVSLIGDAFFQPLRNYVKTFVFGPLMESYEIVPAQLGEEVVVHGAIQLALNHSRAVQSADNLVD